MALARAAQASPDPKDPGQEKDRGFRGSTDCSIRAAEEEGKERTFTLSFSSEEPVKRWFGSEILDHSEGCVDLSQLKSSGVVLFNHDHNRVVASLDKAWVEGSRGYAEITFSDDQDEEAESIYRKVKSGMLKGVSVGYMVDTWEEVMPNKQSSDGRFTGPCHIAKKWAPFEVSIVSVPADPTVGVGRSLEDGPDAGTDAVYETCLRQLRYNENRRKPS